jgi:hypothetical protein
MFIQEALLTAVHAHPEPAITLKLSEPPPAGGFELPVERAYEHPAC